MTDSRQGFDMPALTGVRFIAVSMVFLIHYISFDIYGNVLGGIINQFYLSLHIFFVLSGFIICYKYYDEVKADKSFLFGFYLKRFSRIYPLYFLLTSFFLIVLFFSETEQKHLFLTYLLNITFLKGLSSWYMFSGIYPSWSLTVEEMFYLFSPFIFLLIKKRSIFYPQIIFFWVTGLILFFLFQKFPFHGFFKDLRFIAFATFFGRCFEFFAGIKLALVVRKMMANKKSISKNHTFPVSYTYLGIFCMIFVIVILFFISPSYKVNATHTPAGILISNLIFPLAVVVFFYGLIMEKTVVKRILSTPVFQLLGKGSYAFFLVHTGIIANWVNEYFCKKNILFLYVTMYAVAIVLYKMVEMPLNYKVRAFGNRIYQKYLA
jgi:peptidoglycan/LPS O-acetylase OafA/YrhL